MTILAVFFDDRPKAEPLFLMFVYLPAIVIVASWALIRWKKWLAVIALGIAAAAAYSILDRLREILGVIGGRQALEQKWGRGIFIEPFDSQYVTAAWFAAAFPFIAIAAFYYMEKNRPNQTPERNAGTGPVIR